MAAIDIQRGIFCRGKCFDRHGVELAPGQKVRMQVCIGRYGQTRIVTGELLQVSKYRNVTIALGPETIPFRESGVLVGGTPFSNDYKAGDIYSGCPLEYNYKTSRIEGYHKHDDFEHGHEVWLEVK